MSSWSYMVILYITLPHYHHHTDLSEGIELLKCLSDIFLRLGQYSSLMHYMGLCVFSLPLYLMMIVGIHGLILLSSSNRIYDLCAIVWVMSWLKIVCAICLSIFLWYILNKYIYMNKYSHITPHLITPSRTQSVMWNCISLKMDQQAPSFGFH